MHLDQLAGFQRQLHAAEYGGLRAERLAVHEVAPASHDLADQQSHDHQIGHGKQLELPSVGHANGHDDHSNHRTVNGKPAVPDGHCLAPVELAAGIPEQVQIEDHIVHTGTDDPGGDPPQDAVHQVVLTDAVMLPLAHAEHRRQQQAQRDQDAVPINPMANINSL